MHRILATLLLAALACSPSPPRYAVRQFTVSGDYDVAEEEWDAAVHDRVLTFSGQRLEALGCTITPPDDREYTYTAVHFLPGIPSTVGEGWAKPYTPADAPYGLRSKPKQARGTKRLTWGISPGDPNGEYRIELHINGQHTQTLEFEVRGVPPA